MRRKFYFHFIYYTDIHNSVDYSSSKEKKILKILCLTIHLTLNVMFLTDNYLKIKVLPCHLMELQFELQF